MQYVWTNLIWFSVVPMNRKYLWMTLVYKIKFEIPQNISSPRSNCIQKYYRRKRTSSKNAWVCISSTFGLLPKSNGKESLFKLLTLTQMNVWILCRFYVICGSTDFYFCSTYARANETPQIGATLISYRKNRNSIQIM